MLIGQDAYPPAEVAKVRIHGQVVQKHDDNFERDRVLRGSQRGVGCGRADGRVGGNETATMTLLILTAAAVLMLVGAVLRGVTIWPRRSGVARSTATSRVLAGRTCLCAEKSSGGSP